MALLTHRATCLSESNIYVQHILLAEVWALVLQSQSSERGNGVTASGSSNGNAIEHVVSLDQWVHKPVDVATRRASTKLSGTLLSQSINQFMLCPRGQQRANRQSNPTVNAQTNLTSLWCPSCITCRTCASLAAALVLLVAHSSLFSSSSACMLSTASAHCLKHFMEPCWL